MWSAALRSFAQRIQLTGAGQRGQGLLLELANPLGREAEAAARLAQWRGGLAVDAEPQLDHVALALGQLRDGSLNRLHAGRLGDLVGRLGAVVREQVAEGGLAVLTDRLVEARHRARGAPDLDDLLDGQVDDRSDLLLGRLTTELDGELALDAVDLAVALADVHGQADRAGGVLEAALDRLSDPQRRVRRELEALPPVELLGGADQAQHAFLDQVTQGEALALVLTRYRDHQPEVGVDHPVLGHHVAALDALGQLDLLGGGEQGVLPRLVEEQLEAVGGRIWGLVVLRRLGGAGSAQGLRFGAPSLGLGLCWRRSSHSSISIEIIP